jgi:hypothetical protein
MKEGSKRPSFPLSILLTNFTYNTFFRYLDLSGVGGANV